MTADITDADLRVLRRAAEYAGQAQAHYLTRVIWDVRESDRPGHATVASSWDRNILDEPYASNMEGALRARLKEDGWAWWLVQEVEINAEIRRPGEGGSRGVGTHPAHALLALAYAAERAGAFDKEKADGA